MECFRYCYLDSSLRRLMKHLLLILGVMLSGVVSAADILYQWDETTLRADGSTIDGAVTYHLRYSVNNVETTITTTNLSHTLADVGVGSYVAQVATSEDGKLGEWSETVVTNIGELEKAAPAKTTITVTFSCDDCNLEVK
jgi:hypothetical protein